MSSARTIEEYVEEIVELLDQSDFDSLGDVCDTLERMRYNSKMKYKLTYWRVMQCLGEVSVDKQIKCLTQFETTSCKCHIFVNLKFFMRLFVEMMCNVAVIKRVLSFKVNVLPVLFKAIRQTDEELLSVLALEATYKCLVVGKTELTELFVKYGILKDMYQLVKRKNDVSVYSYGAINIVLCCSKLLNVISICGTENIRKQIRRCSAVRVMGDYIRKLTSRDNSKLGVQTLSDNFAHIKTILGDEKLAVEAFQTWNPKEKLQLEQEQDQLFIFCSAPACRRLYDETVKFRYCGACRLARYCSEECQKDHWKKIHKDTCLRNVSEVS